MDPDSHPDGALRNVVTGAVAPLDVNIDRAVTLGLACRVSAPTHDCGGLLDVVVSREDLPAGISISIN